VDMQHSFVYNPSVRINYTAGNKVRMATVVTSLYIFVCPNVYSAAKEVKIPITRMCFRNNKCFPSAPVGLPVNWAILVCCLTVGI
jgi:hypothetical protein